MKLSVIRNRFRFTLQFEDVAVFVRRQIGLSSEIGGFHTKPAIKNARQGYVRTPSGVSLDKRRAYLHSLKIPMCVFKLFLRGSGSSSL